MDVFNTNLIEEDSEKPLSLQASDDANGIPVLDGLLDKFFVKDNLAYLTIHNVDG